MIGVRKPNRSEREPEPRAKLPAKFAITLSIITCSFFSVHSLYFTRTHVQLLGGGREVIEWFVYLSTVLVIRKNAMNASEWVLFRVNPSHEGVCVCASECSSLSPTLVHWPSHSHPESIGGKANFRDQVFELRTGTRHAPKTVSEGGVCVHTYTYPSGDCAPPLLPT